MSTALSKRTFIYLIFGIVFLASTLIIDPNDLLEFLGNLIIGQIQLPPLLYLLVLTPTFIMFLVWYWFGRDLEFTSSNAYDMNSSSPIRARPLFSKPLIPTVLYPPKNISPSVFGYIADEIVNTRDIVAELVYLDAQKYLLINISQVPDYATKSLHLTKLKEPDDKLELHQQTLMNTLFKQSKVVDLALIDTKLDKIFKSVEILIQDSAYQLGLLTRHPRVSNQLFGVVATLLMILAFLLNLLLASATFGPDYGLFSSSMIFVSTLLFGLIAFFYSKHQGSLTFTNISPAIYLGIGLVLSKIGTTTFTSELLTFSLLVSALSSVILVSVIQPILIYFILNHMDQKTPQGTNFYRQALGIKQYLYPGKYRFNKQEQDFHFDQFLPYLISLNLTRNLTDIFSTIYAIGYEQNRKKYGSGRPYHEVVSSFLSATEVEQGNHNTIH